MQVASIFKSAGFLGAFVGVSISLSVLAWAMQTGQPVRRTQTLGNASGVQAAPAPDEPTTATTTGVVEAATSPGNRSRRGNGPEPGGLIRGMLGGKEPVEEVIKFSAPSTPQPSWLKAGGEDLAALEQARDTLRKTVDVDFQGVSLRAVLDEFSTSVGMSFVIDETNVADAGVTPDQPVVLSTGKLPLNQALSLLLKPLKLNYEVQPTLIKITSEDNVQPGVRYYDLAHVLPSSAGVRSLTQSALALIEPDDNDPTISIIGSMMIVRCRESSHLQIEKLLSEVAKLSPENLPTNESQAKSGGVFKPEGFGGGGGMGGGGMF